MPIAYRTLGKPNPEALAAQIRQATTIATLTGERDSARAERDEARQQRDEARALGRIA